jgi:hypothetical protein
MSTTTLCSVGGSVVMAIPKHILELVGALETFAAFP